MGALGLLLVLHTQQLTGSYAKGGLASGAYAIALAVSNPALARIVDRRGQTLVLRLGAPLAAAAIVVLATAPRRRPARRDPRRRGRSPAPASRRWARACARCGRCCSTAPTRRHAAYSMEGAALEVVYICGPVADRRRHRLLVDRRRDGGLRGLPARRRPRLRRATRSRARGARTPSATRDLTGALRGPGVRVLVAVFVLCGLSVGAVEVASPRRSTPPATAS